MKINVTQRDISLANKRRNDENIYWMISENCPVALAMKRTTKKYWRTSASSAISRNRVVILPDIVGRNIIKWDGHKRMYPFSFEI